MMLLTSCEPGAEAMTIISQSDLHFDHVTPDASTTGCTQDVNPKTAESDSDSESIYTMSPETESEADGGAVIPPRPELEYLSPDCYGSPDPDLERTVSPDIPQILTPRLNSEARRESEGSGAELDEEAVPRVTIETHIPGENDCMTGALDYSDTMDQHGQAENDLMCTWDNDILLASMKMPYKIIPRWDLFRLNLPFDELDSLYRLPVGFLTTLRGVWLALEELGELQCDSSDDALLEALWKRGGVSNKQVVYPEDIIPMETLGSRYDDDSERMDESYWRELEAQGRVWDDIYVP